MKQFQGKIEKWEIHKLSNNRGAVFTGTVLSGSQQFDDGWHMRSSAIVAIRRKVGWFEVETRNSIYHLFGPRGDDRIPFRGDAVLAMFY